MTVDLSAFGVAVGHATDDHGATGLTVIRGIDKPFRGAAAVLGRATGTRELTSLEPDQLAGRVDALMLTGGSAYGLDAAAGVMRWMEERGRGFAVPGGVVPIVPAAVIFDLALLGRFDARPTADMAYAACESASPTDITEGSVGVGTGATVGKTLGPTHAMKGGFGVATAGEGDQQVAAIVVVNALGDVTDARGNVIAGARGDSAVFPGAEHSIMSNTARRPTTAVEPQTTLAVVVTRAEMSRGQLAQLARASSAAFYRRIRPTGTSFDGDIIFALAPSEGGIEMAPVQVETLAVAALESAIERAVRLARGRDGVPGLADQV